MKKVMAIMCSAAMLATGAVVLTSCGSSEKEATTVMNVSCNPEVEFVLDSDNKVVSVNALNEEGNLIISAEAFVGKSAEDAAQLFVEVSAETGFLVSGNVTLAGAENEIEIEISGDAATAEKLYNNVKTEIGTYLTENNIQAEIEALETITKEELAELVAECEPYLEAAEVRAMEYADLLETLADSRKETAEYYSQELKNAYYEAKAIAMEQAELEVLKEHVIAGMDILLDAAYDAYEGAVETIEMIRMNNLVSEESLYQKALAEFRDAKIDFLNYRNYVASLEQTEELADYQAMLANFQVIVDAKESALIAAGEAANELLDGAKKTVENAYQGVVGLVEKTAVKAEEISKKQKEATAQFFNDFEKNYAAAKQTAEENWANMKAELEAGDVEQQA